MLYVRLLIRVNQRYQGEIKTLICLILTLKNVNWTQMP